MKLIRSTLLATFLFGARAAGASDSPAASNQFDFKTWLRGSMSVEHAHDSSKDLERRARSWRLYDIWNEHGKSGTATKIIPYLNDEYVVIRRSATRMLGKLEDPIATKALDEAILPANLRWPTNPLMVNLALGRIQARRLRGRAKLTEIMRSVGLSFDEGVQLTSELLNSKTSIDGSAGELFADELVDVLYGMRRNGESITSLLKEFKFSPEQDRILRGANMGLHAESDFLVDYLGRLDVITPSDRKVSDHLARFGPRALKSTRAYLDNVLNARESHGLNGCSELFRVAALSGDKGFCPFLKNLEKTRVLGSLQRLTNSLRLF